MIHRYQSYIRCSTGRKRYVFDVLKVDKFLKTILRLVKSGLAEKTT